MEQNLQYFLIPFLSWEMMVLIWVGVFAGIWVGAIPGLSVTMAASLLISSVPPTVSRIFPPDS